MVIWLLFGYFGFYESVHAYNNDKFLYVDNDHVGLRKDTDKQMTGLPCLNTNFLLKIK